MSKLGMNPTAFWQLTFAEFWPMYNAVMGIRQAPLTLDDVLDLEAEWGA